VDHVLPPSPLHSTAWRDALSALYYAGSHGRVYRFHSVLDKFWLVTNNSHSAGVRRMTSFSSRIRLLGAAFAALALIFVAVGIFATRASAAPGDVVADRVFGQGGASL
jgi:hypothetical protein